MRGLPSISSVKELAEAAREPVIRLAFVASIPSSTSLPFNYCSWDNLKIKFKYVI